MKNLNDLIQWKTYISGKYGDSYKTALSKMRAQLMLGGDAFDSNHCLKPDLVLSSREREALAFPQEYFDEPAVYRRTVR